MNTDARVNPVSPSKEADEIEISQILLALWSHKRWIALCTAAAVLIGTLYAIFATPRYYSQATLALKDGGKGSSASGIFSQFGGVASQLGMGNTNMPKMEIILNSEELAEAVIKANNLLPVLFVDLWDSTRGGWTVPSKEIPSVRQGAQVLRLGVLKVTTEEKKSIIRIGATMRDPVLAKRVVDGYLVELNKRIRLNVTTEADSNRRYLESQLNNTSDPVLMEKIQSLIAGEIERTMLISSSAYEVLENPRVPMKRVFPKRKNIVLMSFALGLVGSIASILVWWGIAAFRTLVREAGRPDSARG